MTSSVTKRSIAGCALLLIGCLAGGGVQAQNKPTEMAGAKDHPLISRYAGSVLQNAASESFVALRIPAGPGRHAANGELGFDNARSIEGKLSSYFYVQPRDRAALEVYRNYQAALQQAGFTTLYSCELAACDKALIREGFAREVVRPRKWASGIDPAGSIDRDVRFISARTSRNGAEVAVMVYVAEPNSVWQAPVAVVLVAEAAAMEGGRVVIDSGALQRGLAEQGRLALYGLYFDTGKAEIKPESTPQLNEMARLLQANKNLKVAIVGHTDNQGAVDRNLLLSQRRAEAVVASLVADYKLDASRFQARGVASFAPLSSNASEAGRAKNRRVELVEQ